MSRQPTNSNVAMTGAQYSAAIKYGQQRVAYYYQRNVAYVMNAANAKYAIQYYW